MSEISGSSNSALGLQEFSAKIAELVVRKRKLEEARSQGIAATTAAGEELTKNTELHGSLSWR